VPELLGSGDDEGEDLALGGGGGVDGRASGGEAHGQRCALAWGTGLSEVLAGEGLASGSDGVEGVGLGAVAAGGTVRAVELDDQLAALGEEPGQAGAIAAGALDRPRPQTGVLVSQRDERGVAIEVGPDGELVDGCAGRCHDDCGGVGVFVGVDPDDDVDGLCEHGHAFTPCRERTCGSGSGWSSAGL
jgi:hypothetical protein